MLQRSLEGTDPCRKWESERELNLKNGKRLTVKDGGRVMEEGVGG